MNITPEQREVGTDNYNTALDVSRRDFLKGAVAATVVPGVTAGAAYFGYSQKDIKNPVRIGVIGTGDEGNVLLGACNPEYVQVTAICDIRPSSIFRAFHGDWSSDAALAARPGLMKVYGWETEDEARKNVAVYKDYKELLKDDSIEAVIIGLPLHLHAPVAIAAMEAGKHVLTEKLMAKTVMQCKEMGRKSKETNKLLATGHQRHYSILYDNAVHMLKNNLLGELQYIRAQWHRGNLPGSDSWCPPIPAKDAKNKVYDTWKRLAAKIEKANAGTAKLSADEYLQTQMRLAQWAAWLEDANVDAEKYGYQPIGNDRSALEELVRWRLWERTGGGLMVELGSHQLDAASIFCSALRNDGKKAHPLTCHAVGGLHTFPQDRDAYDHVYCMFEFPGPGYKGAGNVENTKFDYGYYDKAENYPDPKKGIPSYQEDPNKKIVVTYSTTMGNGFGGYGETVMGTKGTLILDKEKESMLFPSPSSQSRISVIKKGESLAMDTQASGDAGPALKGATGPISRGYQEEIEHWAWCIRQCTPGSPPPVQVKCGPEVALGDAVIALTTRLAMRRANDTTCKQGGFVRFKDEWFDIDSDATPEEDLDGNKMQA